jgi:hypothetical protein
MAAIVYYVIARLGHGVLLGANVGIIAGGLLRRDNILPLMYHSPRLVLHLGLELM